MYYLLIALFSLNLYASAVPSKVSCTNSSTTLEITVTDNIVNWKFVAGEESVTGEGQFQKEIDTDDAFSSFDDIYAVSYKSNKAVFVFGNGDAIFFLGCEAL